MLITWLLQKLTRCYYKVLQRDQVIAKHNLDSNQNMS